jgi:hypothetical protein
MDARLDELIQIGNIIQRAPTGFVELRTDALTSPGSQGPGWNSRVRGSSLCAQEASLLVSYVDHRHGWPPIALLLGPSWNSVKAIAEHFETSGWRNPAPV